jgi:DNA-binding CsgD family transcriptional regulator
MSQYEPAPTPRQREIAVLMTEGRTVSEMAGLLTLTTEAVSADVEYILGRLDPASRTEVASWVGAPLSRLWLVRPEPPAPLLGDRRRAYRPRHRPTWL